MEHNGYFEEKKEKFLQIEKYIVIKKSQYLGPDAYRYGWVSFTRSPSRNTVWLHVYYDKRDFLDIVETRGGKVFGNLTIQMPDTGKFINIALTYKESRDFLGKMLLSYRHHKKQD